MHINSLKNLKPFQKGHKIGVGNKYRVGKKLSKEHKEALIKSRLGKNNSVEHNRALHEFNLGNKNFLGKKHTKESRERISKSHIGIKPSEETRKKISKENHWNWRGGVTPINKTIRRSLEFKAWREAVFKRDNYTCVFCNKRGGEIHPDHIKPFARFPKLRFVLDNGRTLCVVCHRSTATYGQKNNKRGLV